MDKARISSVRLGLDAYRKAQGRTVQQRPLAHVNTTHANAIFAREKTHTQTPKAPGPSTRELKSTVLKSLHTQSNAGMVSMRDVAQALDAHLKRV